MRYLCDVDVLSNLRNGRTVEQLLPGRVEDASSIVRYISLERAGVDRWAVRLCEVLDIGNTDFIDVYVFPALDPDEPFGAVALFPTPEAALTHARVALSADPRKFVNVGMVQSEYQDACRAGPDGGPLDRGPNR
jgi:hypothetical protein